MSFLGDDVEDLLRVVAEVLSSSRTGTSAAGRIFCVDAGWTQLEVFSHRNGLPPRASASTILPPIAAVCSTA